MFLKKLPWSYTSSVIKAGSVVLELTVISLKLQQGLKEPVSLNRVLILGQRKLDTIQHENVIV